MVAGSEHKKGVRPPSGWTDIVEMWVLNRVCLTKVRLKDKGNGHITEEVNLKDSFKYSLNGIHIFVPCLDGNKKNFKNVCFLHWYW